MQLTPIRAESTVSGVTAPNHRIWLAAILIVAAAARFWLPVASTFPVNDGGLFYRMIQDLVYAGYRLPATTTYNLVGIPFVYPPLGLYLAAFLHQLSGAHLIDVIRLLPPLISLLTVAAFYLVARDLLGDRNQTLLATAFYAVFPLSFEWLIMGGGLTRALGLLLGLLALHQLLQVLKKNAWTNAFALGVLSGAVAVSHLEMAWFVAFTGLLWIALELVKRRSIPLLIGSLATAALVTMPWWATVLEAHGVSSFVAAMRTSSYKWGLTLPLLQYVTIGLLGILYLLFTRSWLLPAWLMITFLLDPRSAPTIATIPMALLFAVGAGSVSLPAMRIIRSNPQGRRQPDGTPPWITTWEYKLRNLPMVRTFIVGFVACYPIFVVVAVAVNFWVSSVVASPLQVLSPSDQQGMAWIAENTPAASRFIVLTGRSWWEDSASEWFPALTGRRSLATVQGYEWLPEGAFNRQWDVNDALQRCVGQDARCLTAWACTNAMPFSHVFVPSDRSLGEAPTSSIKELRASLIASRDFRLELQIGDTLVFESLPSAGDCG